MTETEKILDVAREVIHAEHLALGMLRDDLNAVFAEVVQCIAATKGRVILTGIGKSALIAQKITATLNSTGTPSAFLHTADALHGDMGMVTVHDVLILLSNSGETPEIKALLHALSPLACPKIGITAGKSSTLARLCTHVLFTPTVPEADPSNLVPTTSTTAQLALGDAIAVALMRVKGFTSADFSRVHPGGNIGKSLMRVLDLIRFNAKPQIHHSATLAEAIMAMTQGKLGAVVVLGDSGEIQGIITDGDLRRWLQRSSDLEHIDLKNLMTHQPKCISSEALARDALALMHTHKVSQIILIHPMTNSYEGIVQMHDFLREGLL